MGPCGGRGQVAVWAGPGKWAGPDGGEAGEQQAGRVLGPGSEARDWTGQDGQALVWLIGRGWCRAIGAGPEVVLDKVGDGVGLGGAWQGAAP